MVGYYTTPNQLMTKIRTLYSSLTLEDFTPEGTIRLQNNSDGRGDFIAEWKHPTLAKPTQSQLDAVKSVMGVLWVEQDNTQAEETITQYY